MLSNRLSFSAPILIQYPKINNKTKYISFYLLYFLVLLHFILCALNTNYIVTKAGITFFSELEINIDSLKKNRRIFARPCLDWSERRHHLAGSLGAAVLDKILSLDYIRRTENSRAMVITSKGKQYLYDMFKISV